MSALTNRPNVVGERYSVAIAIGATTKPIYCYGFDAMVVVTPGGGGTLKAQLTISKLAVVQNDEVTGSTDAKWVDWTPGAATAAAFQHIQKATAVRFVGTVAAGTGEVAL